MGAETSPIKDLKQIKRLREYLKDKNIVIYRYFIIAINTGFRANDMIDLTVADIKEAIRNGKFSIKEKKKTNMAIAKYEDEELVSKKVKNRSVIINDTFKAFLYECIEGKKDWQYIFESTEKDKITGASKHYCIRHISREIKLAATACGIEGNVSSHGLRKTYGYLLYTGYCKREEPQFALLKVQDHFGHAKLEDTRRYIGLKKEEDIYGASVLTDATLK
ncbi:tyrosine-type recombinase/integrase [Clostridium perfringens]|uniref:tyrosine-type recombinase/integrase n=1 Tax=Clostridium perfringens TaxID=1502 RepID=UPI0024BD4091|nr:tyrosine-type recombinase/integrase [Clostridium perfringens]